MRMYFQNMYEGNEYSSFKGSIPGGTTNKGKSYTVNHELREFYKLPALSKFD